MPLDKIKSYMHHFRKCFYKMEVCLIEYHDVIPNFKCECFLSFAFFLCCYNDDTMRDRTERLAVTEAEPLVQIRDGMAQH